jgi:uncharacterized repeat protein (TIGR01451 family)
VGGGLFVQPGAPVSLTNTLVARNTAASGGDVSGSVFSSDHNLIGNTAGSTGFSTANGDLLNVSPNLAPLGNYGGPTQTMPLLPGSHGIDAGDNSVLGPKSIPGLAHWYQANGNANDSAGTSNGTLNGGVSYAAGVTGQAFRFNGQSSYVDLGTGADVVGTGAFSVAAWIKTTSDGVILQQRDAGVSNGEYQLAVSGGKVYWWSFGNGQYGFNFTSNAAVNDGNWHYVVGTRLANGTGQIWIDGVLDSSQAAAPAPLGSGIHVYIGEDVRDAAFPGYPPLNFIGQIDEVQIYNGTLTPSQVASLDATAGNSLATDQRGLLRVAGANVDIGATEYQYDLAVTGTAPARATAGQPVQYTFTVANNGPDPVNGVTFTDVLPANSSYVSATAPPGWTVSGPLAGQAGTVIFTDTATLPAGGKAGFTVNILASQTGTSGTTLVNAATVSPAAQDTAPGNNSVSLTTTWSPGPPAGVDIHGQPANGEVGRPIGGPITVAVVDQYGNTITTSDQPVTLAIATGPAGARLGGTTTVRAVHGVATFTNLTVNVAGTYTLTATGGDLTPDFSNPFTVSPRDITDDLRIHRGHLRPGQGSDVFEQVLTITNTTDHTLSGPLGLVLQGLPSNVTLSNAAGSYQGHPFVEVLGDGKLAPGEKVRITLKFVVTGHRHDLDDLDYSIKALLGI